VVGRAFGQQILIGRLVAAGLILGDRRVEFHVEVEFASHPASLRRQPG